jgi:hypothetical protein
MRFRLRLTPASDVRFDQLARSVVHEASGVHRYGNTKVPT